MQDRKAYIDKLAAQLKAWDAEIRKLEGRAEAVKAEVKIEYEQRIRELKTKRQEARAKVEKLKGAGEEAWEELKSGTEAVFADLKNTYEGMISKFKSVSD